MNKNQFAITKDGISQAERWLNTLLFSYVQIDSRKIPDFVEFLFELSKKIHYYNDQDDTAGHWDDFFTSDPNLLIILLSRMDIADIDARYNERKKNCNNALNKDDAIRALNDYLLFIHGFYYRMSTARSCFEGVPSAPETETLIYILNGIDTLGATIYAYYAEALVLFPDVRSYKIDKGRDEFKGTITGQASFFTAPTTSNTRRRISDSLIHINTLFDELLARLSQLKRVTEKYVKERHFLERRFQPQVALFITFLELYEYVKQRMNGLVKKHLDYYYQDVLGIEFESPKPDSVYIVANPEEQAARITISPEDLLLAEIEGNDTPIYFRPERTQVLSRAQLKSIKTIFLSDYKQIEATSTAYQDVKEVQIFKAEHPLFSPQDYLKKGGESRTWAIMGEDQHDRPQSEQTMLTEDPGIAIASPLFYQTEGTRKFTLTFELKSTELLDLNQYIENYSQVRKGMSRETVIHKLFSKAFSLIYTIETGWEPVDNYNAKIYDTENTISSLVITFELNNSQKAFDCYNEAIHNNLLNTQLPVLKVLLNSQVEHYAYSFLRVMQLNRLTLNVKVKAFKDIKLQNNVGPLSPSAPFQPFGPQPSIGSFLDIKNSNVFNRYLKDVTIRINWLELPKEKGGFKTYFESYGIKLENEAFKVSLSSLSGGKYTPEVTSRQHFNLFTSDLQTQELKDESKLETIDFKKISFQNEPQLKNELLINEHFFKDGAIRLELCAPSEAFGHRLFPLVFPDVMLNNIKKFRTKRAIPNQPYVPIIKSIELDYELEYSEGFKQGQLTDEQFQLFHLYPFGYQKIFPKGEKKNYWFMPQFDYSANLLLGLDKAEPHSEVSLFFQMEENSFHHTLHEPSPIIWSYLESDNWVEFKQRDQLSNTTGKFTNSGIVRLRLPAEIFTENTTFPKDLFWIRASAVQQHGFSGRVKAILINGFQASRVIDAQGSQYVGALESSKIKGFASTRKGIESVWQLFPSFGGNQAETYEGYYMRVSERLRHKNRPVQIRDIVQLILKAFPQILIAKLFNSKRENFSIIAGVDLHIVLIPKEIEVGRTRTEQPRVSLSELYRVKTFVTAILSPFTKVEVGNAIYERLKVVCKVMFHKSKEADGNNLRRRFISDINAYIAPWLYEPHTNIKIGSKIYQSEFLFYLKNLSYIKYISDFSMVHFSNLANSEGEEDYAQISDSVVTQMDVIQGSTPASVLIPSPFHIVEIMQDTHVNTPEKSGIGNFIVGEEFLVAEQKNTSKTRTSQTDDDESFGIIISHNIE